jgi:hypothetical protein
MTAPQEKSRPTCDRTTHQRRNNATTGTLTTGAAAICFLVAFTYLRGTEQLLVASVGGLLIGGAK